jgi:hypothetical protein
MAKCKLVPFDLGIRRISNAFIFLVLSAFGGLLSSRNTTEDKGSLGYPLELS